MSSGTSSIEPCGDCVEAPAFMPEFSLLSPAARHIAHGVVNGGWSCDHVDFTTDDVAQAYEALYAAEMKCRDTLRAGLLAIYDHARRDEEERGFGEASRYYGIAEDAIVKSGLGSLAAFAPADRPLPTLKTNGDTE